VLAALAGASALAAHDAPLFWRGERALVVGGPADARPAHACASCHAEEHARWRTSRHARAFDNPVFQADFARTPRQWCLHCHAPLREQQEESGAVRASEGVGCAACHVRDGLVLTAGAPTARGERAHAMRREPRLSSSEMCAGCHQFAARPSAGGPVAMQDTHAEWARSTFGARGQTCQRCHMPRGDHGASGARTAENLRESLAVDVRLLAPDRARVVVETRGVGHAFPTGDPTRVLRVELCAEAACARVLGSASFARWYRAAEGGFELLRDTSVPPPSGGAQRGRRALEVPIDAGGTPTHWRAVYRFAPHLRRELGREATETVVVTGSVATPAPLR
jgi:hypothetical protein